MTNPDAGETSFHHELVRGVREVCTLLNPYISGIANFERDGSADVPLVGLVGRSVIIRQHEVLNAMTDLQDDGRGWAAAPLLRQAIEELIWLKYLSMIPEDSAELLIAVLYHTELTANLLAWHRYEPNQRSIDGGLELEARRRLKDQTPELAYTQLATDLGWPPRRRPPSMKWLAEVTNEAERYDLLYGATSQFVHFSAFQHMRRVDAGPPIAISGAVYAANWGAFALSWGVRVFMSTLAQFDEMTDGLGQDIPPDVENLNEKMEAALGRVGVPFPPIFPADLG